MEEEKNKPRDFGVTSLENFTKQVGEGRNALLTYGIHFDGRYFIDPHSNLTLGRLYCVNCPLESNGGGDVKERYGLVWLNKKLHSKAAMSGHDMADRMYGHIKDVVLECLGNTDEYYEESEGCTVTKYDGYEFIDQGGISRYDVEHNDAKYKLPNLKALDPTYYINNELHQPLLRSSYDPEAYWDSALRRIKYSFMEMNRLLGFVRGAEQACRMFQSPLDKRNLPPEKVIAKITSKLMSRDTLTVHQGRDDVKANGERVSKKLKALNIICDKDRLMEETEVVL